MPLLPQETVDNLLRIRKNAKAILDQRPRDPNHSHSKSEGRIEIIDLVLDAIQPCTKGGAKKIPLHRYTDEEVKEKPTPKFIIEAVQNGVKVDSVKMAVFSIILGRVKSGALIVPSHVIEKDWPRAVSAIWKTCTPGTVSRRFRELQEEGLIEVSEVRSQSREGHWKIERIYGWPIKAIGKQMDLF